jgi:hypothetical protein
MLEWRNQETVPLHAGSVTVTPQARALVLRTSRGGWVWNRPVGVLVEQGHIAWRLPIIDVTRIAQAVLLGLSAALWLAWLARGLGRWTGRRSRR